MPIFIENTLQDKNGRKMATVRSGERFYRVFVQQLQPFKGQKGVACYETEKNELKDEASVKKWLFLIGPKADITFARAALFHVREPRN